MTLENVKIGDAVFFRMGYGAAPREGTVVKLTKTQMEFTSTVGTYRVNRETGRFIGGYREGSVRPMTPELKNDIEAHELSSQIYTLAEQLAAESRNTRSFPVEKLRVIAEQLEVASKLFGETRAAMQAARG